MRTWDALGCYRITADPWPEPTHAIAELPGHLMLMADSLDEWGREHETYRAVPMVDAPTGEYRWFVRADTLWVVWSRGGVSGGIALREVEDGLLGRARARSPRDSVDVSARVRAWKVNCGTREVEASTRLRR